MSSPLESQLSSLLKRVQPAFRHPNNVHADVLAVLHHCKGLSPKLEEFMFTYGSKTKLLQLVGTIPVSNEGLTYNIPISVTLNFLYPYIEPLVFVEPTADQQIKVSKHVDASGKIHLPYLDRWSRSSELLILVQICASTFSQQLPVMAKPKLSWANQPPAPLVAKPKQQPQSASSCQPPHASPSSSSQPNPSPARLVDKSPHETIENK